MNNSLSLTALTCDLVGRIANSTPLYYWGPAVGLYAVLLGLALAPVFRVGVARRWWDEPWLYCCALAVTMFWWKWPFVSLWEMNPDESQIVASALTLRHDPIFWRSVDAGSHGPLIEYALVLPSYLGMALDYGLARAVGLALFMSSTLFVFLGLKNLFTDRTARLAVLPPFTFLILTNYWDYLSFNAEVPVIFLLSLGVWLVAQLDGPGRKYPFVWVFALGLTQGSIPYAKIQGIPLAAALVLWGFLEIWFAWGRSRKTLALWSTLVASGLLPSCGIVIYLVVNNIVQDFYMRYVVQNFFYATHLGLSFYDKLIQFSTKRTLFGDSSNRYFSYIQWLLLALILFAFLVGQARRFARLAQASGQETRGVAWLVALPDPRSLPRLAMAGLFFLSSVYAIIASGFFFAHYYQLLLFPLAGLQCGLLCYITSSMRRVAAQTVLLLLFLASGLLFQLTHLPFYETRNLLFHLPYNCSGAKQHQTVGTVRAMTRPGDTLAVWGWANYYYIESGLPAATRTSPMHIFGLAALNIYYLESYLDELKAARPPVIVDAVAPGMFHYDTRFLYGFERIPQLAKYIQANYVLVDVASETRIYLSKERLVQLSRVRSELGVFLSYEIDRIRKKMGDGVFFVDPRLLAADAIAATTDATLYPPSALALDEQPYAAVVSEMDRFLDAGDGDALVAGLKSMNVRIDYILTKATLKAEKIEKQGQADKTVESGESSASGVHLLKTIYGVNFYQVQP